MSRFKLSSQHVSYAFKQVREELKDYDFNIKFSTGLLYSYVNLVYNFIVSLVRDPKLAIDYAFENNLIVRYFDTNVFFSRRASTGNRISPFWVLFFNTNISQYSRYIFSLNYLGMDGENFKNYFPKFDFRDVSDEIVRGVLKDFESVSSKEEVIEKFVERLSSMLYIPVFFGDIFFRSDIEGELKESINIPSTSQIVNIDYYLGKSKNKYFDVASKIKDHDNALFSFFILTVAKLTVNMAYAIEFFRFFNRRYSKYFGASLQRIDDALGEEFLIAYICAKFDEKLADEIADMHDEFGNTPVIRQGGKATAWWFYDLVVDEFDRNVKKLLMVSNNRGASAFDDFAYINIPILEEVTDRGFRVWSELNGHTIPILLSFFIFLRDGDASLIKKFAVLYVLVETAVFFTFVAEVLLDKISRGLSYEKKFIDNLHNHLVFIVKENTRRAFSGAGLVDLLVGKDKNLLEYFIDVMLRSVLNYVKSEGFGGTADAENLNTFMGSNSRLVENWAMRQAGYYLDKVFWLVDKVLSTIKNVFGAGRIVGKIGRDKRFVSSVLRALHAYDASLWKAEKGTPDPLEFLKAYVLSFIGTAHKNFALLFGNYTRMFREKYMTDDLARDKVEGEIMRVFRDIWSAFGKTGKMKFSV